MPRSPKNFFKQVRQTADEWIDQGLSRLGAALAFYALFAVTPLLLIVTAMAALLFGAKAAQDGLFNLLSGFIGSEASGTLQTLVNSPHKSATGVWETAAATLLLFIGATGLSVEIQDALNLICGVRRVPGRALWNFLKDRLLSFALILVIGLLLLGSLVLSAVLSTANDLMAGMLPAQQTLWQEINMGISFVIITVLFAMIFKILPDVKIPWRDVWMGAIMTSLFFSLGKLLIVLYLVWSSDSSAFGAAGSLVVMMLWVFYSAQIFYLGAKFTQVYSRNHEVHLQAAPGAEPVAVKVVVPVARIQ